MKIFFGILFLVIGIIILFKGTGFCFAVGFHWDANKPIFWESHGKDYASVYHTKAGKDALLESLKAEK